MARKGKHSEAREPYGRCYYLMAGFDEGLRFLREGREWGDG